MGGELTLGGLLGTGAALLLLGTGVAACNGQAQSALGNPEELGQVAEGLETGVLARVTNDNLTSITTGDSGPNVLPSGTLTARLTEGDQNYRIVENRNDGYRGNVRHAVAGQILLGDGCLGSHGKCLLFNGYGTPTDFNFTDKICPANQPDCGYAWSNDRLEIVLSRGLHENGFVDSPQPLQFGQKRYLRVYFRVGADFESPEPGDEIIISQVWQFPGNYPPLAVALKASSNPANVDVVFEYSNDNAQKVQFLVDTVNKNTWHNYYIMMIPEWAGAPAGLGSLLVWKDLGLSPTFVDTQALNYSTRMFAWGYRPTASPCANTGPSDCFDVRVGLYRDVHHELGHWSKHQPVYFDSLKMATNESTIVGM